MDRGARVVLAATDVPNALTALALDELRLGARHRLVQRCMRTRTDRRAAQWW